MGDERETIPLKNAVGMWTANYNGEDDITEIDFDIQISSKQYNRYTALSRKDNGIFSTMCVDRSSTFFKLTFNVGTTKENGRWVVDKILFLEALNEKREIIKGGRVEKCFNDMLNELNVKI